MREPVGPMWHAFWATVGAENGSLSWLPWALAAAAICLLAMVAGWWWAKYELRRKLNVAVEQRTKRLEDLSRRFRVMADNAYDLICISNAEGRMEYLNAAFTRVLGFGKEELRDVRLPEWVHPRNREELGDILRRVVAQGGTAEANMRFPHVGGGWVDMELVAKGLPDSDWVVRSVVRTETDS